MCHCFERERRSGRELLKVVKTDGISTAFLVEGRIWALSWGLGDGILGLRCGVDEVNNRVLNFVPLKRYAQGHENGSKRSKTFRHSTDFCV